MGIWFVDQLAIGTEDVYKTAGATELLGGKTVRPPGALPKFNTKIYSNEDLDGWKTVGFSSCLLCWSDNPSLQNEYRFKDIYMFST